MIWNNIASNALTFFIVSLFLIGGVIGWGRGQYVETGPLETPICFVVPSGSNMARVAEDLVEQGAITSQFIFEVGAAYSGQANALKAGRFRLPEGATMGEITDLVTASGFSTCGRQILYRVGVTGTEALLRNADLATGSFAEEASYDFVAESEPQAFAAARDEIGTSFEIDVVPGTTSWQVVQALNAIPVLAGESQTAPPEGMIAPIGYEVEPGEAVGDLLTEMQAEQDAILQAAWEARAEELPYATLEDALVAASIIEKETRWPEEWGIVSSVIENRLFAGIPLQMDPTVLYGVTEGRYTLTRAPTGPELRTPTPWNTYEIPGLPETPIALPRRETIEAALNPDDTPFIYFAADETGRHAFAVGYDEHLENVARLRALEAERRANQGGN